MTRLRFADFALPTRARGMSPETFANRAQSRELIGGYFYPLDLARALDPHRSRAYLERAVARALRERLSARNKADVRASRTRRLQAESAAKPSATARRQESRP